ncbi:ABC transporter ATP-binding protein [Xaviernesmea oryzae]|uniref:ABC transporter ATP-binding protein n=1 Tax=Xaviernesmea oryzae TaxID=464029 RepID=A0A1Q9AW79_9HYPH|nr:sn-glycerol-3-phosphate ABC transporter ATP-binding protein UgpC [Xaviernesmea oryzae]OLP59688.1 ABC transporter ATP-binding protein [Xaviernesmea oryzae]SEM34889.1 carbohydrate ABC transporter ATP-binding protein, CUT1 family [Xaviernesmea oryzae]
MSAVEIQNLRKSFGSVDVLHNIDVTVKDGEFCVLVGPSGCGKSTLLRTIAGLEQASGGTIAIGGADVTHVAAARRGIAMVFQSYALYPHMTVRDNIGFSLKIAGVAKQEATRRVDAVAQMLRLEPLMDRRPRQLSGGQRQRVAIGRAIVREPKVLLFDEPLSNLDAELRAEMRVELARLHQRLKATIIYVTHDQVEAMTLADKIVVLRGGRVEQIGAPMELYHSPANRFVAGFIGSPPMNFLTATSWGARLTCPALGESFAAVAPAKPGPAVLGIRPEHLKLDAAGGPMLVEMSEKLGATTLIHLQASNGERLILSHPGSDAPATGSQVGVVAEQDSLRVFDPETGKVLADA